MNNSVLAVFIFVVFLTLSNGANVKEQDLEKINQFLLGEESHNEELTSGKEKRETHNGPNKKKSKNNKRKKGMGHNRSKQNKNKTKQKQGKKIRKQRGRGKAKKGKGSRKLKNQVRNSKITKKTKKTSSLNSCSRQTSSTFCPIEKASSLKVLYNQVANFRKQLKRAQNHVKIVKKKKEKSNVFEKDAAIVKDVVGGNLTAPTCPGTAGARKSASEAASKGNMLLSCKQDITTSCKDVTINSTLTGSCTVTMEAFEDKVTECKTDDSCTCWTEAFAMKPSIIACNALNEADAVKTKKKTCLKTFSGCKKAQDSAVEVAATCPDPVSKVKTTTATAPLATTTTKAATSKVPQMSNTTAGPTTTPEMEDPVTMIFETPVNMTAGETPVNMTEGEAPIVMTMETSVEMTQTASTKAANRKERFVQDFMLKSLKNYFVRT